ncbi:MAG: hypothetical protein KF691_04250 [Phycisphaeraceae bacterium]|nr:hypothetical protein [Phycisphaeraceae bacterium]
MNQTREPNPRLRALAGLLAEHSVPNVFVVHRGTRRELHARATDLPHELESIVRDDGVLEIPALQASILFSGGNVRCVCANTELSIAILKALAVQEQT